MRHLSQQPRQAGFTLIELVVSIVLSSIVGGFIFMFIVGPVEAYTAQQRRAELVDATDALLRLMGRDIRRALPNSVRTLTNGNIRVLEILSTIDATRYRDTDPTSPSSAIDELDFATSDTQFATLGKFEDITRSAGGDFSSTSHYLSIYNVGVPTADAYEMANVITPRGTQITIGNGANSGEDRITLSFAGTASTSFKFAYGSPARRVYLVSGPVTYLCNTTTRTLQRYSGYSIVSNQALRDTDAELMSAGATRSLVANDIGDCTFTYLAGTAQRAGLVTLDVTVARIVSATLTERVRLLNQVHVENAP